MVVDDEATTADALVMCFCKKMSHAVIGHHDDKLFVALYRNIESTSPAFALLVPGEGEALILVDCCTDSQEVISTTSSQMLEEI